MAYPTVNVNTTNLDVGTDNPALARTDLLDLAQKFNLLRPLPTDLATSTGAAMVGFGVGKTVADLGGNSGAPMIGYMPDGYQALASTVEAELKMLSVHVKNYGALTNGSDATAAINKAILAAQKLKSNQFSPDEVYSVKVLFEGGKDYFVLGPILLPSGIILDGQGCRINGNYASAATTLYNDAAPSLIETAYYDGITIASNRAAAITVQRLVGAGIKNFYFKYANCAVNAINMNEQSFISNCVFNNCSAAYRLKSCFYMSLDNLLVRSTATAATQYATYLYGTNCNSIRFNKVHINGAATGMLVDGRPNAGITMQNCSFEACTKGLLLGTTAFNIGWKISESYFENTVTGIELTAGSGFEATGIENNFFSGCQYALLSTASGFRTSRFSNNSALDGGGVVRNLVDVSQEYNDIEITVPIKASSTSAGPVDYYSNIIQSNFSTPLTASLWNANAAPNGLIGRSKSAASQNSIVELPFEGRAIVSTLNEIPFVTAIRNVDTLTIITKIPYDLSNVLLFNLYGATDSVTFDIKGFLFGLDVSWVTHTPVGVTATVSNYSGFTRIDFGILAPLGTINVTGLVRHA